jgi:hypothetical protein
MDWVDARQVGRVGWGERRLTVTGGDAGVCHGRDGRDTAISATHCYCAPGAIESPCVCPTDCISCACGSVKLYLCRTDRTIAGIHGKRQNGRAESFKADYVGFADANPWTPAGASTGYGVSAYAASPHVELTDERFERVHASAFPLARGG